METRFGAYLISDDPALVDPLAVASFLARSYWADTRPIEAIKKSIANSLCIGAYLGTSQAGFARVVTDRATIYWLCDVWVDEAHRGGGLGKALVEAVVCHPDLAGLNGILATRDAHGLYERFGFERVEGRYMRRAAPRASAGQAVP